MADPASAIEEPIDVGEPALVALPTSPSRPLGVLFRLAHHAFIEVTDSDKPGNDESLQKRALEGLSLCEAALLQVERQAIFSTNELGDDINTGDLKYLLLPFYRGELLLRVNDQEKRLLSLREAMKTLRGFVGDQERLELLATEAQGWQQVAMGGAAADPAEVRNQKIARMKANKAAKARLEIVEKKLALRRGVDEERDDDDDEDGDELEREQAKINLQSAVHTALDSIRSGEQEADMLKQIAALRKPDGSLPPKPALEDEDPRFGLQMHDLSLVGGGGGPAGGGRPGGMQSNLTGPLGLRTVDPTRDSSSRLSYATAMQQIHTGNIPGLFTYSVEEGLRHEEAERALGEAARMDAMSERAAARAAAKDERQLGNDEEDEEERLKLIKQDEFREMNKKGSGNRKNRS